MYNKTLLQPILFLVNFFLTSSPWSWRNFSQPEVVDPSSKLLESTEKSQWRWTSFTGADFFGRNCIVFFLLFFLGMVVWKRGPGFWQLVCFFLVGCLCFFGWLVWRELLYWNKDRECRLFFCGWKERCMKMVITTFKNVLSVAYLSPEQQRIAHIGWHFLWFPPRWRLLSLWNLCCLKEVFFANLCRLFGATRTDIKLRKLEWNPHFFSIIISWFMRTGLKKWLHNNRHFFFETWKLGTTNLAKFPSMKLDPL